MTNSRGNFPKLISEDRYVYFTKTRFQIRRDYLQLFVAIRYSITIRNSKLYARYSIFYNYSIFASIRYSFWSNIEYRIPVFGIYSIRYLIFENPQRTRVYVSLYQLLYKVIRTPLCNLHGSSHQSYCTICITL